MDSSTNTDLTLPIEWDGTNEMMDEELSASSSEEANKVFEQWKTDEHDQEMQDLMEVDEQIGSDLLGPDLFQDPTLSPTGPIEELVTMSVGEEELEKFSIYLLNDKESDPTSSLPFEERYKATLQKLAKTMKASQETRKSLKMKSSKTESYPRSNSICGVLTSIEKSSQQLQVYLKKIDRI